MTADTIILICWIGLGLSVLCLIRGWQLRLRARRRELVQKVTLYMKGGASANTYHKIIIRVVAGRQVVAICYDKGREIVVAKVTVGNWTVQTESIPNELNLYSDISEGEEILEWLNQIAGYLRTYNIPLVAA
ncbi:MAG: hypothetical protein V4473_01510 [Patescibacteria group bacterium]